MEAVLDPAENRRHRRPPRTGPPGLSLTEENLEEYLRGLKERGRVSGTLDVYRRNIFAFYDALPEDKTVQAGDLSRWRQELLSEGYSPRTVNACLSAANGLMAFLGRRDLQSVGALEADDVQPELTRTEYLRLLSTARALNKERLYLLVKLFGSTGLPLQELPRITVEALDGQRLVVRSSGTVQLIRIPDFLRQELRAYAQRNGIVSGPLFCTRQGKPLGRSAVTDSLKRLCRDARVPVEKANPRCLKRLWQATQDSIRSQVELLVEQACDRLLESEQLSIGWDSRGVRGP